MSNEMGEKYASPPLVPYESPPLVPHQSAPPTYGQPPQNPHIGHDAYQESNTGEGLYPPPGYPQYQGHAQTQGQPPMGYSVQPQMQPPVTNQNAGISQPSSQGQRGHDNGANDWKHGLLDCFSGDTKAKLEGTTDTTTHCIIYWVVLAVGLSCCLGTMTRSNIRQKRMIEGGLMGDACIHCCCHCCALIQENREFGDEA
ncbi:hypothetical protein G9A89_002881 [Geosiphon pyriformis]|nr:hypothetical protein G9A89_002881 [Geosiphon pyriformis]